MDVAKVQAVLDWPQRTTSGNTGLASSTPWQGLCRAGSSVVWEDCQGAPRTARPVEGVTCS
jgi:hypothetical protein